MSHESRPEAKIRVRVTNESEVVRTCYIASHLRKLQKCPHIIRSYSSPTHMLRSINCPFYFVPISNYDNLRCVVSGGIKTCCDVAQTFLRCHLPEHHADGYCGNRIAWRCIQHCKASQDRSAFPNAPESKFCEQPNHRNTNLEYEKS